MSETNHCIKCTTPIPLYSTYTHKNGRTYVCKGKPIRKYCDTCISNRKIKTKVNCLQCNKEIILSPYQRRKFCSQRCSGLFNKSCEKAKSWEFIHKGKPKKFKERACNICTVVFIPKSGQSKNCEICQKKINKDRETLRGKSRIKIKMEIANKLKRILTYYAGSKCNSCGYNKCMRALCFHHKDELIKDFTIDSSNIMKLYPTRLEKIIEEIDKCELLCQNCHADLHQKIRYENVNKNYLRKRNKYTERKYNAILSRNSKCKNCERLFTLENLQSASFHHIDKTQKLFSLDSMAFLRKDDESIKTELEKCCLLCMNCHMEEEERIFLDDELNK